MEMLNETMRQVYQMLEDEESRFTWLKRLNYLITGDFQHIEDIVTAYLPELPRYGSRTRESLLAELPEGCGFVLFGAGIRGAEVLPWFCRDQRFVGFCSSTREKQTTGFLGWPVISPEELSARKDLGVIISSVGARSEIIKILENINHPKNLIFTLDGLEVSYNDQYFGPEFMVFENEEVFVDVGSCNLRDAIKLREHCGRVKKVYAFEPSPENRKKCLRNKEVYQFPEAEIIPFGAWSTETTLHFDEKGGTSQINEDGRISISVKRIDDVIPAGERVTLLKMDIEGSELEALKGAQETIRRNRPKLAICIYHKPEDMVEIPLYIRSLVPEYKFYVRHHSNYWSETVLYAV